MSETKCIRVGGVPEHFNRPIHRANELGEFTRQNIQLDWHTCDGGTGDILNQVKSGAIDIGIALTEGITARMLTDQDHDLCIISPYVASPLRWAVIVGYDSPYQDLRDIEGLPIAVSRMGSGSHLMSYLLAEREGWNRSNLNFSVRKDLRGLRQSVNTPVHEGGCACFLWEYHMTKPFADDREVRFIGTIDTPWPCFMMVARRDWARQHKDTINEFLSVVRSSCEEFCNNPVEAVREITAHYGLPVADARGWFREVGFAREGSIDEDALVSTVAALHRVGIVSTRQIDSFLGDEKPKDDNMDSEVKWSLYKNVVNLLIDNRLVRILPPLGEGAIFDGFARSVRARTADMDFGSIGGGQSHSPQNEPSPSVQGDTNTSKFDRSRRGSCDSAGSRAAIIRAHGMELDEPGELAARNVPSGIGQARSGGFVLRAGHMAFTTAQEYERWRERKAHALKTIEGHLARYGGIIPLQFTHNTSRIESVQKNKSNDTSLGSCKAVHGEGSKQSHQRVGSTEDPFNLLS